MLSPEAKFNRVSPDCEFATYPLPFRHRGYPASKFLMPRSLVLLIENYIRYRAYTLHGGEAPHGFPPLTLRGPG